jgi:voltage-gated potassium channel
VADPRRATTRVAPTRIRNRVYETEYQGIDSKPRREGEPLSAGLQGEETRMVSYVPALAKALIGIVCVLSLGTVGYRVVEGWPLLESFYMTVITLTTIGFGEVRPLTDQGRVFTIVLIFVGVGMVSYTVVTSTRLIVEGEIHEFLTRRRSMKAVQRIRDHFIICGFGRMGSYICHHLHERHIPFVVVEKTPETQMKIMELGYLMCSGDATEEETLLNSGIQVARGLVAVLDSDAENLYTVLTAREIRPDMEIIARAAEESAHKKLLRAGASRVISPYQIGAMRMLMSILKPTVMTFLEVVTDRTELNVELEEVEVAADSIYCGKRLMETDIRRELNLIIIAIKKRDGSMVFNPGPDTAIDAQDTLIAMGTQDMLARFEKKADIRKAG